MDASSRDRLYIQRALDLAARGIGRVEPNPMVGAVVVQGDRIVGEGYHQRFGGPHAEVIALQAAGSEARRAELFVSLEPCCHQGKTPPCTGPILASGIRRVVAAVIDPFPQVSGRGMSVLKAAGLETVLGVMEEEARRLNAAFFKRQRTGLPLVIAKWAMTLDGRLATAAGESRWISSEESRRRVHEVRRIVDAVLVGAGTVLADEPSLTVRHVEPLPERGQPTRVVVDGQLAIDPAREPMRTARQVPVIVFTSEEALRNRADKADALRQAGCELVAVPRQCSTPAPGREGRSAIHTAEGGCATNETQRGGTETERGGQSCPPRGSPPNGRGGQGFPPRTGSGAATAPLSLRAVLENLGRRGMSRVLVEGGARIFRSLFAEGLADRVMVFVSPKILGSADALGPVSGLDGRSLMQALQIHDMTAEPVGPDILIQGRLGEF
jgi:diaminohydroxyphosphoribosylaminopyrimidine deaminase/5-amino-6-(5-phosphoribosylamino)uracil reductase